MSTPKILLILSVLFLTIIFYHLSSRHQLNEEEEFVCVDITKAYRKNPQPKIDERNVEVLNANNFSDFIVKNQHVIVMFYGQWYTWCQKVAPESAAAAKQLKVWWRLQILMLIRRKSCRKSMKFQGILHFIYLLMDYLVWKILHQPGEFLLSLLFDS